MNAPEMVPYNEFSMFGQNIAEYSISASATPTVQRVSVQLLSLIHI